VYERRQTDMKEKFTKPEINVLMNIIIGNSDQDQKNNIFVMGDGGDIIGSMVPGDGGEDWD
jgi:hypothetical protein